MKFMATITAFAMILATHVAWSADLKINGDSKETFVESTKEIVNTLTVEEKEVFHKGLMNLILTKYPPAAGAEGFALVFLLPQAVEVAHVTMDGVTKSEILQRGRELIAKEAASSTNKASTISEMANKCWNTPVGDDDKTFSADFDIVLSDGGEVERISLVESRYVGKRADEWIGSATKAIQRCAPYHARGTLRITLSPTHVSDPLVEKEHVYLTTRECLQRNVTVSNVRIEKSDFVGEYIKMDVTNNLPWAISFVHLGYQVITSGRSVPWSVETFGMNVSGGIEPGETREISTNASAIPSIAKDYVATAEILDVADAQKRHLVGEVKFNGNSEEITPLACK